MARKKARRSTIKKKRKTDPMVNRFNCPECNHENVVIIKMGRSNNVGQAVCNVCNAKYKCKVTNLSTPVDVYSDWIDHLDDPKNK